MSRRCIDFVCRGFKYSARILSISKRQTITKYFPSERVPREEPLFSTCETLRALELVSRCIELKIDTFNPRVFRRQISLITFKNKKRFRISNGKTRKIVLFEKTPLGGSDTEWWVIESNWNSNKKCFVVDKEEKHLCVTFLYCWINKELSNNVNDRLEKTQVARRRLKSGYGKKIKVENVRKVISAQVSPMWWLLGVSLQRTIKFRFTTQVHYFARARGKFLWWHQSSIDYQSIWLWSRQSRRVAWLTKFGISKNTYLTWSKYQIEN